MEEKVQKTRRQSRKKKKRILKNEESLRKILNNMNSNDILIMRIPEGESEQGIKNLFEEIMTKNLPNLVKEKVTQVQESQRVPNKLDSKKPTSRHIIIKMTRLKDKERILKPQEKSRQLPTRNHQLDCHLITQQKYVRPEGSGMKYSR